MDSIFINSDLPVDNKLFPCVVAWSADWKKRNEFLEQATEAFSTEPTMNGVIHGRRKVKLGKRGFSCSYFPSAKNATGSLSSVYIPMESKLEAALALELERDLSIRAFRTQAIETSLPGGWAFPDFLAVDTRGNLSIREVKADKRYLSVDMQERIEHLTEKFARWGFSYSVVDSFDLPQGTKLANLFWLNSSIYSHPRASELERFLNLGFSQCTYGELKTICNAEEFDTSMAPFLIFTEQLKTNWAKNIDDNSKVWK